MTTPGAEKGHPLEQSLLPVCLLSGGLGTRLGPMSADLPKALVEVAGEPFVMHQLRLLAECGAGAVVMCVGHRGEMVERTVGRSLFGLEIAYSYDSPGLDGTLGAIRRALGLLPARFLFLYGDTYLPIDYLAVQAGWLASGMPALMTVLRNDNEWGASNVLLEGNRVLAYDKVSPGAEMRWIDYGLGGLDRDLVDSFPAQRGDLALLQADLARRGQLYGHEVTERFHEIGTPEALEETRSYLRRIKR